MFQTWILAKKSQLKFNILWLAIIIRNKQSLFMDGLNPKLAFSCDSAEWFCRKSGFWFGFYFDLGDSLLWCSNFFHGCWWGEWAPVPPKLSIRLFLDRDGGNWWSVILVVCGFDLYWTCNTLKKSGKIFPLIFTMLADQLKQPLILLRLPALPSLMNQSPKPAVAHLRISSRDSHRYITKLRLLIIAEFHKKSIFLLTPRPFYSLVTLNLQVFTS